VGRMRSRTGPPCSWATTRREYSLGEPCSGADAVCRELDVLMLGCMFPKYTSVTAKKSLKWVPLLGWFSTSLSNILV
jgi:hypothetical protein